MTFRDRFFFLLEKEKLNIHSLSKIINLASSNIHNLVYKSNKASKMLLLLLEKHFNINPRWLSEGISEMYLAPDLSFFPPKTTKLVKKFEKLPERYQNEILDIVEQKQLEHLEDLKEERKLSFEKTTPVPIVGILPAGGNRVLEGMNLGEIEVPNFIIKYDISLYFALKIEGNSMIDCEISSGSVVLFLKTPMVNNNDIVFVDLQDEGKTLKKWRHLQKEKIIELVPCQPDFKTLSFPLNTVVVLGKVVYSFKKF